MFIPTDQCCLQLCLEMLLLNQTAVNVENHNRSSAGVGLVLSQESGNLSEKGAQRTEQLKDGKDHKEIPSTGHNVGTALRTPLYAQV